MKDNLHQMPRHYLNKWHFKEKTVKFRADNDKPRSKFDPRREIEKYRAAERYRADFRRLWVGSGAAARIERVRKRRMLAVAFGCLAGAALLLALWIGR